jgi:hypothetical protein
MNSGRVDRDQERPATQGFEPGERYGSSNHVSEIAMTTMSDAGMPHPRALETAATRRQVLRALPVAAAEFAIPGSFAPGERSNVQAQTAPALP